MTLLPLLHAGCHFFAGSRLGTPGKRLAVETAAIVREGGVVAQKVAQIVAARPDLVSDVDLLAELRELQSREISPGVHRASIATVTLDRTRGVAVKRLNDDGVVSEGRAIARLMAFVRPFRRNPQVSVLADVLETLCHELDFESETDKNALLRRSLPPRSCVRVPVTLRSSATEVEMEIVESTLVKDLRGERVELGLVRRFFKEMATSAVRTGVVHLDLHSGNVGVDAGRSRVVVYDMGSVRQIDAAVAKAAFSAMLQASEHLFFEEWDELARHLVEKRIVIEVRDVANLRLVARCAGRYARGEATSLDIGRCLRRIKGDVNLDASIFQLVQSVSLLEGCCKVMNPDFHVADALALNVFEVMGIMDG